VPLGGRRREIQGRADRRELGGVLVRTGSCWPPSSVRNESPVSDSATAPLTGVIDENQVTVAATEPDDLNDRAVIDTQRLTPAPTAGVETTQLEQHVIVGAVSATESGAATVKSQVGAACASGTDGTSLEPIRTSRRDEPHGHERAEDEETVHAA
jgi:hypothetical protein